MGVLRALGYTKFDAMKLFLIYGTSAALLGTALGSFFGTGLLPRRIYRLCRKLICTANSNTAIMVMDYN